MAFGLFGRIFGRSPEKFAADRADEQSVRLQEDLRRVILGDEYIPPEANTGRRVAQGIGNALTLGAIPAYTSESRPFDVSALTEEQQGRLGQMSTLEQALVKAQDARAFADILADGAWFEDVQPKSPLGAMSSDNRRGIVSDSQLQAQQGFSVPTGVDVFAPSRSGGAAPFEIIAEGRPEVKTPNPGATIVVNGQPTVTTPESSFNLTPGASRHAPDGRLLAENLNQRSAAAGGRTDDWIYVEPKTPGQETFLLNKIDGTRIPIGTSGKTVTTPQGSVTSMVGGDPGVETTTAYDNNSRLVKLAKSARLVVAAPDGSTKVQIDAVEPEYRPGLNELLTWFEPLSVQKFHANGRNWNDLVPRKRSVEEQKTLDKLAAGNFKRADILRDDFTRLTVPYAKSVEMVRALVGSFGIDDPSQLDPDVARRVREAMDLPPNAPIPQSSAARDLAMIFSFMKVLDRESVVRESEQELARRARSMFSGAEAVIDRAFKGTQLNDTQRADFLETALQVAHVQMRPYFDLEDAFIAAAERNGLDSRDVVIGGAAFDGIRGLIGGLRQQEGVASMQGYDTAVRRLDKAGTKNPTAEQIVDEMMALGYSTFDDEVGALLQKGLAPDDAREDAR